MDKNNKIKPETPELFSLYHICRELSIILCNFRQIIRNG